MDRILRNFRWYRKVRRGLWYKVIPRDGFDPIPYWVCVNRFEHEPLLEKVLETEHHFKL